MRTNDEKYTFELNHFLLRNLFNCCCIYICIVLGYYLEIFARLLNFSFIFLCRDRIVYINDMQH